MSFFYCDICDRTIKLKYKMKHLNIRLHRDSSMSVVSIYCVKNPSVLQKEDRLRKHIYDYKKGLDFLILYVNEKWILITLSSV